MKIRSISNGDILDEYYQLIRKIGIGGSGCVYEALCLSTFKKCAIKTIRKTQEKMGDLVSEVLISGIIDHPNVARCLDVFETHEYIHIVMSSWNM